jgi:hypothetical protein
MRSSVEEAAGPAVQRVRSGRTAALREKCMMPLFGKSVDVGYTSGTDSVGIDGVGHCGSSCSCPMCAPMIRERRAQELDALCTMLLERGYVVRFVTATISHYRGDRLLRLMRGLSDSWRYSIDKLRRDASWVGQVRAWDFTYGRNGWHPHFHNLLVFQPGTPEHVVDAMLGEAAERYSQRLRSEWGMTTRLEQGVGWHVQRVTVGSEAVSRYVSKVDGGWGVGLEMARGDLKRGQGGSVTPWDLLRMASHGDHDAAVLWFEYEKATKGLHAIQMGRKLRALAREQGIDIVDNDAELCEPDAVGFDYVETFTASEWAAIVCKGMAPEVIERVQRIGRLLAPPD